jgi:hypothetical protein
MPPNKIGVEPQSAKKEPLEHFPLTMKHSLRGRDSWRIPLA